MLISIFSDILKSENETEIKSMINHSTYKLQDIQIKCSEALQLLADHPEFRDKFNYPFKLKLDNNETIVTTRYQDAIFQFISSALIIFETPLSHLTRDQDHISPGDEASHHRSHFYRINDNSLNSLRVGTEDVTSAFHQKILEEVENMEKATILLNVLRVLVILIGYALFICLLLKESTPKDGVLSFFAVLKDFEIEIMIDNCQYFQKKCLESYSSNKRRKIDVKAGSRLLSVTRAKTKSISAWQKKYGFGRLDRINEDDYEEEKGHELEDDVESCNFVGITERRPVDQSKNQQGGVGDTKRGVRTDQHGMEPIQEEYDSGPLETEMLDLNPLDSDLDHDADEIQQKLGITDVNQSFIFESNEKEIEPIGRAASGHQSHQKAGRGRVAVSQSSRSIMLNYSLHEKERARAYSQRQIKSKGVRFSTPSKEDRLSKESDIDGRRKGGGQGMMKSLQSLRKNRPFSSQRLKKELKFNELGPIEEMESSKEYSKDYSSNFGTMRLGKSSNNQTARSQNKGFQETNRYVKSSSNRGRSGGRLNSLRKKSTLFYELEEKESAGNRKNKKKLILSENRDSERKALQSERSSRWLSESNLSEIEMMEERALRLKDAGVGLFKRLALVLTLVLLILMVLLGILHFVDMYLIESSRFLARHMDKLGRTAQNLSTLFNLFYEELSTSEKESFHSCKQKNNFRPILTKSSKSSNSLKTH